MTLSGFLNRFRMGCWSLKRTHAWKLGTSSPTSGERRGSMPVWWSLQKSQHCGSEFPGWWTYIHVPQGRCTPTPCQQKFLHVSYRQTLPCEPPHPAVHFVVQSLSHVWLSATAWTAAQQAPLSFTICWSLLKLMSIESVMSSNSLVLCPLLLLPSVFPSIRVFSNESALRIMGQSIGASASILPMNIEDWLPLGLTGLISLQSNLMQSKASILWHSASFMVQLSHPYTTTGKTIALTRWTFVGKVMLLLFNMLSRYFIAFLPRSKHLLISWLQSLSAVILEPKKINFVTISIFYPSICHEVIGPDAMIFLFWMLIFKPAFSLSSFTFIKRLFSSLHFLP